MSSDILVYEGAQSEGVGNQQRPESISVLAKL